MKDFNNHPCFNDKTRHLHARVHLPVAPKCNIQCNFCNRKYDCVNESRPGVTSKTLTPSQALVYVDKLIEKHDNLSVIGIAGPGDAFATPKETLETLRLIDEKHPDKLLCLATNGLVIGDYIDDLVDLNISHVTVTINAVKPEIGAKIYSWVRYKKRMYHGESAAELLINNQLNAVKKLKEKGIIVKVNTIIIPGVNDEHIEEIAEKCSEYCVDIFNCIPLYPVEDSVFENNELPSDELITKVRFKAGKYVKQMFHCKRCRADAVGLLGEGIGDDDMDLLSACSELSTLFPVEKRKYVAVASMEGVLINQHLGEARQLLIYEKYGEEYNLIEKRNTPPVGDGKQRWDHLAYLIRDCHSLFVSGIGKSPSEVLNQSGIKIYEVEGIISALLKILDKDGNLDKYKKVSKCGMSCTGTGTGCG